MHNTHVVTIITIYMTTLSWNHIWNLFVIKFSHVSVFLSRLPEIGEKNEMYSIKDSGFFEVPKKKNNWDNYL